ncbi:MAG TPA: hypothetical protein VER03_14425 [Bryobacteraceae bacterium]|nr:hypothetical protein [Bryobacteraceae bacterium]
MKTLSIAFVLSLVTVLVSSAETIRGRQSDQRQKITQGVRSGELTRPEASRLYSRNATLTREYIRDRHDGAGLTPAERRRLTAKQNRLGRSIYLQKHDGQQR